MIDYDTYKDAIIFEREYGDYRLTVERDSDDCYENLSVYNDEGKMVFLVADPDDLTALRDALNTILADDNADPDPLPAAESDPTIRIEALRAAVQVGAYAGEVEVVPIAKSFERSITVEQVPSPYRPFRETNTIQIDTREKVAA